MLLYNPNGDFSSTFPITILNSNSIQDYSIIRKNSFVYESGESQILVYSIGEKPYKKYIEECLKNTKASKVTHCIEFLSPFCYVGGSILIKDISAIASNYNKELSDLLITCCGAMIGLAAYNIVNLLLNKRYETVLREINNSNRMYKSYSKELDNICNAESYRKSL